MALRRSWMPTGPKPFCPLLERTAETKYSPREGCIALPGVVPGAFLTGKLWLKAERRLHHGYGSVGTFAEKDSPWGF